MIRVLKIFYANPLVKNVLHYAAALKIKNYIVTVWGGWGVKFDQQIFVAVFCVACCWYSLKDH